MIEVRCFGSLAAAAFLRDEVNALNRVSTRPDPFSTFEFFENYLRHDEAFPQGQGLHLWFLAALEAGRLVGYMALKRVTHSAMGLRAAKLDFLVTHDADRPQLVARPQDARAVSEAFYAYLLERRREWGFLEFRQQDAASPLFPPPAAIKLKGYWVRQWPSLDNGTIHVRWGTLDSYFRSFSSKFRSNVSRQMRSLLAAGDVEYLASSDPATTPVLFELYQSIEKRSWKSGAGVAIGRNPLWLAYFKDPHDVRHPMRLAIHVLLLDGMPVAGLITGAFEQGLYALHMVFDNSLSRLSPGSAVLLMGMRQAIDGRYAFVNLLSGFGYYKVRWHAQMAETRNAQIYRIGTPFFWRRLLGDMKRWVLPADAQRSAMHFNPARRDVVENYDEPLDVGRLNPRLSAGERARVAGLSAQVREGRGEFLSASELAALMPFATQRPAPSRNR